MSPLKYFVKEWMNKQILNWPLWGLLKRDNRTKMESLVRCHKLKSKWSQLGLGKQLKRSWEATKEIGSATPTVLYLRRMSNYIPETTICYEFIWALAWLQPQQSNQKLKNVQTSLLALITNIQNNLYKWIDLLPFTSKSLELWQQFRAQVGFYLNLCVPDCKSLYPK